MTTVIGLTAGWLTGDELIGELTTVMGLATSWLTASWLTASWLSGSWLSGVIVIPVELAIEVIVIPVDDMPVDVVPLLWVVVDENESAPPSSVPDIATLMLRKSGAADVVTSDGAGVTAAVPGWLVVVVEKVARDPLGVAGDAETPTGVTAAATPWWLGALVVCPWCATAWWTAWATGPAPDRTTRSSRHDADPESDGTKRRWSHRDS